jgi:hypothetical protein
MIYNDIESHWFSEVLLEGSVDDVMKAHAQIMEMIFVRRNPPVQPSKEVQLSIHMHE